MSYVTSIASVGDVVQELHGTPSTTTQDSYNILDQVIPAQLISNYLMEGTSWLRTKFSTTIYQSLTGNPYLTEIVRRFEIHYTAAHVVGAIAGFIITDGYNIQINGVTQSRYEPKFNEYKALIQFHSDCIIQMLQAIDPVFYATTPTYAYGSDVYGNPIYYNPYPSTIY